MNIKDKYQLLSILSSKLKSTSSEQVQCPCTSQKKKNEGVFPHGQLIHPYQLLFAMWQVMAQNCAKFGIPNVGSQFGAPKPNGWMNLDPKSPIQ